MEPPTKRGKTEGDMHENTSGNTANEAGHHLYEAKIESKELLEAIQKMKYGKAAGPDGIIIEY